MAKILKTITAKDNALSIISLILIATIVIVDLFVDIDNIGLLFELVLIVLGLISLSQIAEREDRFAKISEEIKALENQTKLIGKPAFLSINELTPITKLMESSQELFYTGGHLHTFIHTHTNHFEKWLHEGKSIRLILQDPTNVGLKDLHMPCVNYDAKKYITQIKDSLGILEELHRKFPNGRLGVKVTNITPTQSVSIFDGNHGGSQIFMLHHLPNGDSSSAPFMHLDPRLDSQWFKLFFDRYYNYLWDKSRTIISHPDD